MREISSSSTHYHKIVLPRIMIGFVTIWAAVFMFAPLHDANGQGIPTAVRWVFLLVWLIISRVAIWFSRLLFRVRTVDSTLYISDYRQEIQVPISQVQTISENWGWSSPPTATVTFLEPTPFGRRITFVVKHTWFPMVPTRAAHDDLELLRGRGSRTGWTQSAPDSDVGLIARSRDKRA